jgi:Tol biopolymer transport system component
MGTITAPGSDVRDWRHGAHAGVAASLLFSLAALAGGSNVARAASVAVALDLDGLPVASSSPALSRDGRFVAFRSSHPNIVRNDTNHLTNSGDGSDIFVRDRRRCTTERVSVGPGGVEGDGNSIQPVISRSGRFVVFLSKARTLVPNGPSDNETRHLYIHDRRTHRSELVDVTPAGEASAEESPLAPFAVSANGRYVAFSSTGGDLVGGDGAPPGGGGIDAFVRDRRLGRTIRVERRSLVQDMSDDGRFVLFNSAARLSPDDEDDETDLYVRDLRSHTNRRINVIDGVPIRGPGGLFASLSDDGCVAVFAVGGQPGIAVYDCRRDTTMLEVAVGVGVSPVVAGRGRRFAFHAPAGTLGPTGGLFVHDRATGIDTLRVPLEDSVLPPQFHLSGDGRVLGTGSPVTVHGDLPAVPTACEQKLVPRRVRSLSHASK